MSSRPAFSSMASRTLLVAISILGLLGHVSAADVDDTPSTSPSAVFQGSSFSNPGSFVFAANYYQPDPTSNATADLYIHMSALSTHQWMAVGLGDSMKYTLMWIAYQNYNGTGTTLSTRLALGHQEPAYDSNEDWGCEQLDTGATANGTMSLNAVCRGVTRWDGTAAYAPALQDIANNSFIYALGPRETREQEGTVRLRSDDPDARIEMHTYHGGFTMQLQHANASGVPKPNGPDGASWTTVRASTPFAAQQDGRDMVPIVHGVLMCLAFILVFPSGALVLRFTDRVLAHAAVQTVGLLLVLAGLAAGIVVSIRYQWSVHLLSAHQIIGVLVVVLLAVQLGLGVAHHRVFKKREVPRPTVMGRAHKVLGPALISAGVLNAPLGLWLAGRTWACGVYVGFLVLVVVVGGVWWFFGRRQQMAGRPTPVTSAKDYEYAQFGGGMPGLARKGYRELSGGGAVAGERRRVSYKSEDVVLESYEASRRDGMGREQEMRPRSMV